MSMAFLGCNPRHHSLAFGCGTPAEGLLAHFTVEVGWGGLEVRDETTASTYQITKPSFWGHRPIITR